MNEGFDMPAENIPIVKALAGLLVSLTDTQRAIAALVVVAIASFSVGVAAVGFRQLPERVEAAELAIEENALAISGNRVEIEAVQVAADEILAGQRLLCRLILEDSGMTENQIVQACGGVI